MQLEVVTNYNDDYKEQRASVAVETDHLARQGS
jgi:hypothetical protein